MSIVQCENHHYYDDQKDSSCPYCAKIYSGSVNHGTMAEQVTSYYSLPDMDDDTQLTEMYGSNVEEYEKTIGIFAYEEPNELTAGWLVCVDGVMKGRSYPVHVGRNFAGRSLEMDLPLTDDMRISRKNHFSIVFDPKSILFFVVAGTGQTYVNQNVVTDSCQLQEGDELEAGQSKYIFIPFCKEGRVWN